MVGDMQIGQYQPLAHWIRDLDNLPIGDIGYPLRQQSKRPVAGAVGAIVLLALVSYCIASYLLVERRSLRLTWAGYVRGILLGAVMITGIFRVLKNLPNVVFSPGFTMFIDVSHFTFMVLFFLAACLFLVRGSRWVRQKTETALP